MQILFFFLLVMLANNLYGNGVGAAGEIRKVPVPADFKPFMDKEGCGNCYVEPKAVIKGNTFETTQVLVCACKDKNDRNSISVPQESSLDLNECKAKHKTNNIEDLKGKIHNKDGKLVCGD